ncbi:MAG: hypothetical protein K1X75_07030 [Leptospirales bacterium]|nr:hypothetical protein [Leptospirales bacterium]
MKALLSLLLGLTALVPAALLAGPTEGIRQEFRRVEEAIRNQRTSPEMRLRTLEENLTRAVRAAVLRHYYAKRSEYLNGLSAATIQYEALPASAGGPSMIYYVKYRNFLLQLHYAIDPQEFIQSPTNEKFLESPGDDSHSAPTNPGG